MVDEFRAEELSTRCGKNLVIYTSDPQKVENTVIELFPDAKYTRTPDNAVSISGHIEDAGIINQGLVNAGVMVNALIPEGENLEAHFLRLMGGETHG